MTNRRAHKAIVAVCLLAASGVAAGWGCPPVIDAVWVAGVNAAEDTVGAAIKAASEAIGTARVMNIERVQSALKVLTKQMALSADQQAAVEIAAKKGQAEYLNELANRKAIFETTLDYSMATGQGFDPCGELARSKNVALAVGEANHDMQEKVIREIDAAPGRLVANQASVVNDRINLARTTYCTADEARMGVCQGAGPMAGKDVDVANFFTSYDEGTPQTNAKDALLNYMYGLPYQTLPKDVATSPQGQAFMDAKRNEDAFSSVSAASLKTIQSWTEGRVDGSAHSDSVLDALAKKVDTYAGGDNYAEWEKTQASQSERGLLVEYAKMSATELYMLDLEYQQQGRIEANIAALQALHARGAALAGTNAGAIAAQAQVK